MGEDKNFYLKEGSVLRNLKDLAKNLKGMPSHVYGHHVNDIKNDFAAWVKDSLGDVKVADRIEGSIAKIEMELEVLRHLVHDKCEVCAPVSKKKKSSVKKKKTNSKKKK